MRLPSPDAPVPTVCTVGFVLLVLTSLQAVSLAAEPTIPAAPPGSPVAVNGFLSTKGNHIVNESGDVVQLRGVCTHGLQWRGDLYKNGKAIKAMAGQWGADVIRLTVYVYESGYLDNPKLSPADFDKMIDGIVQSCVKTGVYCILDWHVHHPGDPAYYLEDAKAFFSKMAKKYSGIPNVLYEIANEPNKTGLPGKVEGRRVTWKDISAYADEVIPIIRARAPRSLVMVGTPDWSSFGQSGGQDWRDVVDNPLPFKNTVYVVHFYAAGHGFYRQIDQAAETLPLFATEWAASTWETDSKIDLVKSRPWIEMINRRKIGWTYWTLSAGNSVFDIYDSTTTSEGPFSPGGENVTETGRLLYSLLNTPKDQWSR